MLNNKGFDLWAESDADDGEDDLSRHNIWAIKERIERLITVKEQNGLDHSDLLRGIGIGDRELNKLMGYFSTIDKFEKAVSRL